jgi:uncharacterized protein YbjT (DUF2867 family)
MAHKLITVFGSTGNQGGSVVRAILNHPQLSKEWKIRGLTRNASKPDAQALANKGVEMVSADLNSKDSIAKAIDGSDAVFGVTNYWEKGTLEHEVQQGTHRQHPQDHVPANRNTGRNLTDAAKETGVPHLIWSSLPHVSRITSGKLHNLHHFDSKALVEEYITSVNQPASFVMPAYFMSNIPASIKPTEDAKGYTLSWLFRPDTLIPMLNVPLDFGKFVASLLDLPPTNNHTYAASGWFTPLDVCQAVENVTGKPCKYREVPIEEFTGSKELLDNLLMIREYEYYGPGAKEGVERSQEVVLELGGWKDGFGDFEGYLRSVGFGRE